MTREKDQGETPSSADLVRVRFRKWPDRPHWAYDMYRVGEDGHGTWLFAPEGTITRRADEPPNAHPYAFLKLVPRTGWWTAIWNAGGKYEVYVDINTPARWPSPSIVTMVDLDLDVVRFRATGEVAVLDEDEFAEHRVAYDYPGEIVAKATATTARIREAVGANAEPFRRCGPERLVEAVRSLHYDGNAS